MYEFDRSTPVTVVLRAHGGSVDITAEDRLTIEVDVQPMGGGDAAAEAAQRTRVELEDDTLVVEAPGGDYWSWRRTPKLRITLKVPAGSALAGKSAAADVRAAGLYSTVQLNVASADVSLEEALGDVSLESASGDLTVRKAGGSMRLKSASGDLRTGDVTGDVSAQTASGDIRLGVVGGSLLAGSASGDIEVGQLRQGQAQAKTASGDVKVGIAAGSQVWMDLNTASGKTVTDLTSQGDTPPTDRPVTLELQIRTASGDIRVHRATGGLKAVA
jgi:DUF4097 and DUF4098 domain-containing protein YvlB